MSGRKPGQPSPSYDLGSVRDGLVALCETRATDADGRIRVEDLLSAASAVCGEACMSAAGEVDPEHHALTPGAAVLSDRINGILSSDTTDWAGAGESVFGLIRTGAIANGYAADEFPTFADVYRTFAAGVAGIDATNWGFVPLSVPADNHPRIQPIRDAYELRPAVRALFREHAVPASEWPALCGLAVAAELGKVRAAIAHGIAIRLVLETINGMAKTAPMTDEAFRQDSS